MPAAYAAFSELDWKCINTIRVLAADMVQAANSGHPGAPMGCAPLAHILFTRFLRCDPDAPAWMGRDRFVLSNGHACALQYIILHLLGYNVTMDDLKQFRQLDSKYAACHFMLVSQSSYRTPGHPESHFTPGIETTTGPLGQGFGNAVGLAMAEAHLGAVFNVPDSHAEQPISNYTYVLMGDGCMQEGVASEAASLAGHLGLGKLIVLYDDNHVSIDGNTNLAFTEDVDMRFRAYGFHTLTVKDGDHDLEGIANAILEARTVMNKPSLIRIRTTIGIGAKAQGTEKVHGSPLGPEDVASVKKLYGFDPREFFFIPQDVRDYYHRIAERWREAHGKWNQAAERYKSDHPEKWAQLQDQLNGKLPDLKRILPRYEAGTAELSTRKLSENVLNAIANSIPALVGGSADLTGSNLTKWKGSVDFQKDGSSAAGSYAGRYIRFGVREHGMFAICNGLAAYGGLIPFASTFLNFISYGMGAVRLAALAHFRVLYIMTHDSIGLGEDGPTHQPIETLAMLRALPNLLTIRPADGNEVSGAYLAALEQSDRPSVLCLSRQNLPQLQGTSAEAVLRGAYVLESDDNPQLIIVGTGSEMAIGVAAANKLRQNNHLSVRLVSMPCWELFEEQPHDYKSSVLLPKVPTLSIEAAASFGWTRYAHGSIGMTTFGSSGPYKEVYHKFGFTADNVAANAIKMLEYYKKNDLPPLLQTLHFD